MLIPELESGSSQEMGRGNGDFPCDMLQLVLAHCCRECKGDGMAFGRASKVQLRNCIARRLDLGLCRDASVLKVGYFCKERKEQRVRNV